MLAELLFHGQLGVNSEGFRIAFSKVLQEVVVVEVPSLSDFQFRLQQEKLKLVQLVAV